MSQYYFAVASLPHLIYNMDKVPPIEQFIEICEKNCSSKDLKLILAASFEDIEQKKIKNTILNNWFIWERNLRNKLVLLRAKKRNVSPEEYIRENPELFVDDKFIREAFEDDSPLEAEDILNYERWSYLDSLEIGHYFDEIKLMIYYLRLQILWRRKDINKEKGTQVFNEILEKFSSEDIPYTIE